MSFGRTIKGLLAIAFSTALTEGAELDYGKDIQTAPRRTLLRLPWPGLQNAQSGIAFRPTRSSDR